MSYAAVRALAERKERHGQLPHAMAGRITELIDGTVGLLSEIDRWQAMPEGAEKAAQTPAFRARIRGYNQEQFRMVRSQQRPIDLGFSRQQWFDTEEAFRRVSLGR